VAAVAGHPCCVSVHQDIQLEQWNDVFQYDDWQSDPWQQIALRNDLGKTVSNFCYSSEWHFTAYVHRNTVTFLKVIISFSSPK